MFIDIKSIKSTKTTIIMLGLLFIIPFILYFPSLSYDFLYELDDDWIVINNPSIKMISDYGLKKGLKYLFYYDTTDFHYHPITYLSYSIDYILFGINSYELKLHNLLLHITSGILVFVFVHLLIKNKWLSFIVALLFLIHPINIESIAWISCRRQSLFYTYFLLSAISYKLFLENRIKRFNVLFFVLSIIFWIISTLAKASAIVMPAVFVLIYIHANRNKIKLKTILFHIVPMLPFLFLFIKFNEEANARNFLVRDFTYSNFEHFIFAGYTYFFYWIKGLFPFPIAFFYPAPSENLVHLPVKYFLMIAASCSILLLLLYHFIKKQNTLFFAIGFYSVTILPMLNLMFYPLGDLPMLVSNRYFYHTSLGIILYLVLGIHYLVKNNKIKIGIAMLYFVALVTIFRIHLPVWSNQVKMLENDVKYYPSEEMLYLLALEYNKEGKTKKALDYLDKGDKLGTNIWINNGWSYYEERSKLYIKSGKYNKALNDINKALSKREFKTISIDSLLAIEKQKIEDKLKSN